VNTWQRIIRQCWLNGAVPAHLGGGRSSVTGALGQSAPDPQVPRCTSSHASWAGFSAWFVCAGVLVTKASARGAGGVLLRRACLQMIRLGPASVTVCPSCIGAPHSTARPAVHATGTKNRNVVQGRGRGYGAGGHPLDALLGVGWLVWRRDLLA